jgi:glycosyltransferase involved in cell wall biosynthesis
MASLYKHQKIIAHITLSRGEGYSLPLLEASMSGKPIIAPNYSGHLDFLKSGLFIALPGQLNEIPKQAVSEYYPEKSKWFDVDENRTKDVLRDFYLYHSDYISNAQKLATINQKKFGLENTIKAMHSYYDSILTYVK